MNNIKLKIINPQLRRKFPLSPLKLFSKLYKMNHYAFILESVEGPRKLARYSFLGFNPEVIIKIKDRKAEVIKKETGERFQARTESPLNFIRKFMTQYKTTNRTARFVGGAVGYISYDIIRQWENIPSKAKDDLAFPDVEMGLYTEGIIFDHSENKILYHYQNRNRLSELDEILSYNDENEEKIIFTPHQLNFSQKKFENSVEKAKEYIFSGDIFQVVLSKRFEFNVNGSLIKFYKNLRKINPSPYMYYLKMGERQIIGSSPEMLARVENGIVETFPIAGTRPRKKEKPENTSLVKKDLLSDPKELAEHVMLVDLARNDVGKVSCYGDVKVSNFMKVQKYSHVYHIVSQVSGRLRNTYDSYDTLQSVFPAGTVSGAPKVRAMEIIEELEPTRRGPYAGAIGYFSFNGNADFAITIRTMVTKDDKAFIQAGAGVVADSKPENEWFETEHKARALFEALRISGGLN